MTKCWHILTYLPTSACQRSLWMTSKGIDLYQSRPNQKCLDSDGSTCGKDSNQDAGYPVKRLKIVPNQSCQLVKKSRQSGPFCKILSKKYVSLLLNHDLIVFVICNLIITCIYKLHTKWCFDLLEWEKASKILDNILWFRLQWLATLVVVKIGACMCGWNFVGSITQWDENLYDEVSEIL